MISLTFLSLVIWLAPAQEKPAKPPERELTSAQLRDHAPHEAGAGGAILYSVESGAIIAKPWKCCKQSPIPRNSHGRNIDQHGQMPRVSRRDAESAERKKTIFL